MADESLEVNSEQVEALAEKLEAFASSLTVEEREILSYVLNEAASNAGEEVTGYAFEQFSSPVASNLGRGVNMTGGVASLPLAGPGLEKIKPGSLRAKEIVH
jgi:hypothetical protein